MFTKMMQINTVRSSNLELLRIVAMFGIVLSHYELFLQDLMSSNPVSTMSIYHYVLGMWGKIGINCFMFITGYFMCIKDISIKKYFKLLAQIYFYNILIQGTFMAIGRLPINFHNLSIMLFPFRHLSMDSFITDFIWFYLFIPFVSILIKSLNRIQHRRLILLSLCIFVVYSLPKLHTEYNPVCWFSTIMLVASYIRMYGVPYLEGKRIYWGYVTFLLIGLAVVSIILCVILGRDPYTFVGKGNSILSFLIAVSMFQLFNSMKMGYSSLINAWGASTFGVLLIHSNCSPMREWIYTELFNTRQLYMDGNWWMPLLVSILILVVCSIVEFVRQQTIEPMLLKPIYRCCDKYAR